MVSWKNTRSAVHRLGLGLFLILLLPATGETGILDASWTAPTTNTDGSPLTDLASYRVYYKTSASPCPGSPFVQVAAPTSSPGPNQTVSTRLTGLLTGTTYFVSVTAVDASGNESACPSFVSAVARTDFGVSPSGTVNFGSVSLASSADRTFTVSNTGGGTVSGSASVPAPFSIVSGSPFTLNGVGATRTVTVRFTPVTAMTSSATISFTANGGTVSAIVTGTGTGPTPDTTRPTVTITSPTSSPSYSTRSSTLTLGGTASDNAGVTQVTWTNSRGGAGTASGTTSWSTGAVVLQTGANGLTVSARDAAGNVGTGTLTVVYDPTPPSIGLTAPGSGSIVSGTTTVTAAATDNVAVAGVQFLLDGLALGVEKTSAPFSISWTTGTAADGPHTLSARARDAAGNTTVAVSVPVTVSNAVPPPTPSPSGLVAAYSFNQGAGATVADASGNNNNGTLGSGIRWTTRGRFGSALVFTGEGFVTVPATASLNLTTAMTLEAWVFPTAGLTTWRTVLFKEQPGQLLYALYAGSPTKRPRVLINASTSPTTERSVLGPSALPLKAWSHLAATYDGSTLRLFINGTLVGSQPFSGSIATATGALRIGGNSVLGQYFRGRIDEIRIYNRVLSQTEIQTDMNTAIEGGTLP